MKAYAARNLGLRPYLDRPLECHIDRVTVARSVLDCSTLALLLALWQPHWHDAVVVVVDGGVGRWEEERADVAGRLIRGVQEPVQPACDRVHTVTRLIDREEKLRCWS